MYMDENDKIKIHGIIHTASTTAAGIGGSLAQIPGSDNAIITPIQITMIISIGKVLNIDLSQSVATSLLGTFTTGFVGRFASQALLGWIPIAGNIINASTAASITEAVGWAAVKYFENLNEEETRKYKKAKEKGVEEEKARMETTIKEIKKKAEKIAGEYKNLENFYMAGFAIGIAAGNINNSLNEEKIELLKKMLVGLSNNLFPECILKRISEFSSKPPTFNDAMVLVNEVDRKHWDLFDSIIKAILTLDKDNMQKKSEFKQAWNQKYCA